MVIHSGVKNYSCKTCKKQFARKGEVEDHERIHTGEKPFQCEICGATFSQRSNLQSHKRATHYEEKKHQCDSCNKAFKRRRLLVYHMMSVHTGERPFKCTDCNAAFVYPEHYKKHLRIHTGEKPFKCDICGKAFNSRDNRNAHKFIHSERKPYECNLCNAGFMRKPMLLTHLAQHGPAGSNQLELCVRVNPPTVADEVWSSSQSGSETIVQTIGDSNDNQDFIAADAVSLHTLKMPQEGCESVDLDGGSVQLVNGDTMEVVARPVHIIEADDLPRYLLQGNDRGGPFLASIQGQMVELRPESLQMRADGLHYQFTTTDDGSPTGAVVSDNTVTNTSAVDDGSGGSNDGSVLSSSAVRSFHLHLGNTGDDNEELELQALETNVSGDVSGVTVAADGSENNTLLSQSFQFEGVVDPPVATFRAIKVLSNDTSLSSPTSGDNNRILGNRSLWTTTPDFIGP